MSLALAVPAFAWAGPPTDSADFLAQHQADLAPFFTQDGATILKDSLPTLVSVSGDLLLVTAIFGWVLDVPLSWGFATIFSPAYAKFPRALVYACGRLAIALVFTVALSFCALLGLNAGAGLPALLIVAVLTIPAIVIQVFWVGYQFHTPARPSLVFYFVLLAAHGLALTILVPTLFAPQVKGAIMQAINRSVVPDLQARADDEQRTAAADAVQRDAIKNEVTKLQDRLSQDQSDEQALQQRIDAAKEAPALVFSHLVLLRAQGQLAEAGTGLADFIRHYPGDPHVGAARGQLNEVNEALSAQLALQRQQQAQAATEAAHDRARLQARLANGQATLSEVRRALLGKTTREVAGLFGAPTATEANRWGYGKRMIFDPQSRESLGLTIVFSEGLVQGVDYYYEVGQ